MLAILVSGQSIARANDMLMIPVCASMPLILPIEQWNRNSISQFRVCKYFVKS